eukprot:snap_masked-scaffold_1-processed-gene-22.33-mRNA-1 protein AED:1.00 eAED:1.00 QI:0/-1/0/0/-1/1/1/0/633
MKMRGQICAPGEETSSKNTWKGFLYKKRQGLTGLTAKVRARMPRSEGGQKLWTKKYVEITDGVLSYYKVKPRLSRSILYDANETKLLNLADARKRKTLKSRRSFTISDIEPSRKMEEPSQENISFEKKYSKTLKGAIDLRRQGVYLKVSRDAGNELTPTRYHFELISTNFLSVSLSDWLSFHFCCDTEVEYFQLLYIIAKELSTADVDSVHTVAARDDESDLLSDEESNSAASEEQTPVTGYHINADALFDLKASFVVSQFLLLYLIYFEVEFQFALPMNLALSYFFLALINFSVFSKDYKSIFSFRGMKRAGVSPSGNMEKLPGSKSQIGITLNKKNLPVANLKKNLKNFNDLNFAGFDPLEFDFFEIGPRKDVHLEPHSWQYADNSILQLRVGPNYGLNKQKASSGTSLFVPVSVYLYQSKAKLTRVMDHLQPPTNTLNSNELPDGIPRLLVINIIVPRNTSPGFSFGSSNQEEPTTNLIIFLTPSFHCMSLLRKGEPSAQLLKTWLSKSELDPNYEGKIKILAHVLKPEQSGIPRWLLRYNGKPCIVQKTKHVYRYNKDCIEIDVDLSAWSILTRKAVGTVVPDILKNLQFILALVIQGDRDNELPERPMFTLELNQLDATNPPLWPPSK